MDIYAILSSKDHNRHYLIKYVSFIQKCQEKNTSSPNKAWEHHHICPKARDMFPQFSSLKDNPWNCVYLTPRQHFIAHTLIWKTFPTSQSQRSALWAMKHKNGMTLNSRLYEKLKIEMIQNISNTNSNTTWINNGTESKIVRADALHEYMEQGWILGRVFTQAHRRKISENASQRYADPSRNPNYGKKRRMIVKMGVRKCVEESQLQSFIEDGWVEGITPLKYKNGVPHTAKPIQYEGKVYSSIKECVEKTGKSRFIIKQSSIEL